jgi:hypothetical protein
VSRVGVVFAHGHGDRNYIHYTLYVYPSDNNQIIGSIAKLLHDLERPPMSSSLESLCTCSRSTNLYKAILVGSEECKQSIALKQSKDKEFIKLHPILHVQSDNCWKDNKSKWAKCFWSLLVARGVFDQVQVSFMLVGHTHDDFDASFGR